MNRLVLCVVLFLCLEGAISSQVIHSPINSSRPNPGVYDPNFLDAFSFTGNQAVLAYSRKLMAGIYSSRKFLIDELEYTNAALSFPAASGGIGFQITHFGFSQYNESELGISYGRKLGKLIDLGIQFNYYTIQITGYGHAHNMHAELGLILHLSDHLHAGIYVYDPAGIKLNGLSNESLSSIFKTGIGYEVSAQAYFQLDLIKEVDQPIDADASLHLILTENLFCGLGIQTNSFSPYGWAAWSWKKLKLGISVSHHPQLGFTPGIYIEMGAPVPKKQANR
ncbi:MAG: hypothetical protein ACHQEM_10395 [Chitinophagales bacterium]